MKNNRELLEKISKLLLAEEVIEGDNLRTMLAAVKLGDAEKDTDTKANTREQHMVEV